MSPKLRPKRALLCALALGLCAPGCRNAQLDAAVALAMSRNQRKARAEQPRPERHVERDPRTGEMLEDRRRTSYGPGGYRNEGPQRTWYPGGASESFREYTGGELRVHGQKGALDVDTRGRFVRFDGRYEHEVLPYEGTRYSVIYFQLEPEWSVDPSSCES